MQLYELFLYRIHCNVIAELSTRLLDTQVKDVFLTEQHIVPKLDEALDKLHIALRVQIPSGSFQKDAVKADKKDTGRSELAEGHCAIGLEKLCKLALCASEVADSDDFSQRQNVHVRSSVAQLLIKDGVPMYNMDASTLQRELVTLCCTVELIIHDEKL